LNDGHSAATIKYPVNIRGAQPLLRQM
jgi:hypothetical protein